MGTFTNLVFSSTSGQAAKNYATTTGPLSLVLQSLNRFKTYLHKQDAQVTNVLTGFLLDQESVCDQYADTQVLSLTKDTFGEIDADVAASILNAISETSDEVGCTLTDVSGNVVQFMLTGRDAGKLLVTNPLQLYFDSPITIDSGLQYLLDKHELTPAEDTLLSKAYAAYEYYTGSAPAEGTTLLDAAQAIAPSGSSASTILDLVKARVWKEVGGIPSAMKDTDIILKFENGKYFLNNALSTTKGLVVSTWELLSNAIESQAINNVLLSYVELATSGVTSADAYVSAYVEFANSKFASVRETALSLRKSFAAGGIYGLAKAVLNFAKATSSTDYITSEDGTLAFTDNSKFVPQEYIAGFVSAICDAIASLLTVITAVFSRILGAVVGILGGIVKSIVNAINYDYETETLASIVDEEGVAAPISPYGIMQFEFDYSKAEAPITDYLSIGNPCVLYEVPGGWLLIGYGSFDDDGLPLTLRCEFHPGLDRNDWGFHVLDDIVTKQYNVIDHKDDITLNADLTMALLKSIVSSGYQANDDPQVYENTDMGVVDTATDDAIRSNIFTNMVLFLCWFYSRGADNEVVISSGANAQTAILESDATHRWMSNWVMNCGVSIADAASLWTYIAHAWCVVQYREDVLPFSGPSYEELPQLCAFIETASQVTYSRPSATTDTIIRNVNGRTYFGEPLGSSGSLKYAIKLPKYNRSTFFGWVALSAVVTSVVAVATIALTVRVRSFIRRKQAINAAKVYQADDALKQNPTAANYRAYKKAVSKNNLFAKITGGTKYDKVNVWNAAGQATDGTKGVFSKLLPVASDYTEKDFKYSQAIDINEFMTRGLDETYRSITGLHLLLD